jgi:glycine cleavage system H protein
MPDDRTFMMGKYAARLPGDLLYARNHMWARNVDGGLRFGFTAYAIRLMQDVYFLEWHLSDGDEIGVSQLIGHIETSKAVSDLFAPLPGTIIAFNGALLDDPSGINLSGYEAWLFEIKGDTSSLLTVDDYHQFLDANWEKTQRHIKGKINTEED